MTHDRVVELAQAIRFAAGEIGYGVDDLLFDLAHELRIPIEIPTQE